jgi:hypothetical protein
MSKKTDKLFAEYAGKVTSDVFLDGNYSVVLLTHKKVRVIGIAKRNPESDVYIAERGVEIATARALQNLDKQVHPRRYKKVK